MAALATDPTGHEPTIRTYLDHYLPPSQRDEALSEAFDEARHWRDTDLDDVLRCTRRSLLARTVPAPESEAAVLVVRCGLEARSAAHITGLDEISVRRAANVLGGEDLPSVRPTTPTLPGGEGERLRRQERLIRLGIVVLLGVALLAAIGLVVLRSDDDDPPPAITAFDVTAVTVAGH